MIIGGKTFHTEHETYIMGILNITPDSFSDGGSYNNLDKALRHAEDMIREGADVIDVGGESTRPGHVSISQEEEIERVVPVIEALHERFDVVISSDTYKAAVADEAIKAGAALINDVWGLKYDDKMAGVIAAHNAACCLMHNRKDTKYQNFMEDLRNDLLESIAIAEANGISRDKIILDPGIGFAKTKEQNLQVLRCLEQCKIDQFPLLLGTSRKSVIGLTLDLPTQERMEGTLVTTVLAVMKGYSFVRVHDVKENARAIRMTKAILGR